MLNFKLTVAIFLLQLQCLHSSKIILLPFPEGFSHVKTLDKIGLELENRGHEVSPCWHGVCRLENHEWQLDDQKDSWVSEILIKLDQKVIHTMQVHNIRAQYSLERWKFPVIIEYPWSLLVVQWPFTVHHLAFSATTLIKICSYNQKYSDLYALPNACLIKTARLIWGVHAFSIECHRFSSCRAFSIITCLTTYTSAIFIINN